MKTFSIHTPNGTVSGFEVGDGKPVVLIAGLGSTSRIWGTLPGALGRKLRVFAVDNRGVGQSDDGGPFTLDSAVEDVVALLDDRGIERAALLGASMGGVIALKTAAAHPDRVSRLVIASSAPCLTHHGRRVLEMLQDMLLYAPPDRTGAALMTLAFAPPFHEKFPGFVTEADRLYGIDGVDLPGTALQVEHLIEGWDLRPALPSIDVPALVLAGDRDPVVAPEETAELAAKLPRAELIRLPHAAHSVLAEGGEPVLARVSAFLEEKPPRP